MLHDGVHAQIKADSYEIPQIFDMLAKDGDIAKEMMYNTYNMGVGMILAVDAKRFKCFIQICLFNIKYFAD